MAKILTTVDLLVKKNNNCMLMGQPDFSMDQASPATTKESSKWRMDIGETVHEDTTPKDYFSNNSLFKHFFAGGAAGLCSRTATAPLDRLKVFIQVNKGYSIKSAAQYLYKEGGLKAFWRGNLINVVKIAPESAIKFMAYEETKRVFKWCGCTDLDISHRFMSGAVAGAFAQAVIYPLEVLKTRMVLRTKEQRFRDICADIWRHGKYRGFYKGFVPNLIGIFPYAGIDLAVYETIKNVWIRGHSTDTDPGVYRVIVCGIVSSSCGQVVTYPLVLVRTRLQALAVINDQNQTTSMIGQFKHIWHSAGIFGLYRGFVPNFLKVMPAVAISYVTYEKCRALTGAKMS